MSYKLKSFVIFFEVLTCLLILRSHGLYLKIKCTRGLFNSKFNVIIVRRRVGSAVMLVSRIILLCFDGIMLVLKCVTDALAKRCLLSPWS